MHTRQAGVHTAVRKYELLHTQCNDDVAVYPFPPPAEIIMFKAKLSS